MLYYTKADIQYRRWLIAECLGNKGGSICCETQEGNDIPEKDMRKFKLAHAYLDLICDYDPLAPYAYADESVEERNCITETQLENIFAWFEAYCCTGFPAKESVTSDSNGDIAIVPDSEPSSACCLALESGALILVEDSVDDDCIALEETTCLLASDPETWKDYYQKMTQTYFYNRS